MIDLLERIDVLVNQEMTVYKTVDYLGQGCHQRRLLDLSTSSDEVNHSSSSACLSTIYSPVSGVNIVWRELICEWSYQFIDFYGFSREVVAIAVHYLDRFLAVRDISNKKEFQLLAMTTLFLAVKLNESSRISMSKMVQLGRGYFTVEQMIIMEHLILHTLSWHVHPPTAYCFCKHAILLLPKTTVTKGAQHDIIELARFLTELAVLDYFFVVRRPSSVALAALLYAMEHVEGVTQGSIADFKQAVQRVPKLNPSSHEVRECKYRMHRLYEQGGFTRRENVPDVPTESSSPVSVSHEFKALPHSVKHKATVEQHRQTNGSGAEIHKSYVVSVSDDA